MNFEYAIILDFEATCDEGKTLDVQEIIEFPSVVVELETLTSLCEFESFVRPLHNPILSAFCKSFTAIKQRDVDEAEEFKTVFAQHNAWLGEQHLTKENAIFVTCGDWDLMRMLPAQCRFSQVVPENQIYHRWLNIKSLFQEVTGKKGRGMVSMLSSLNIALEGHHHRGIDDCRNISKLFCKLLELGGVVKTTGRLSEKQMRKLGLIRDH